jgi:hypothetical protein
MDPIPHPDYWIAVIPPQVLERPVRVKPVLDGGFVETHCPLCDEWLSPEVYRCPACKLTLDWRGYRNARRAAWNSVKDWLLDRITYAEPPPVDEAVEVGEALLDTAYGAIPNARALLDDADDKPLRWLLRRWDWCRRNQ